MNTTLTPTTRHDDQLAPPRAEPRAPVLRRPSIIDRAALHLGMALIRWGRRPTRALARRKRLVNGFELGRLHRERERLRQQLEYERARAGVHALIRVR